MLLCIIAVMKLIIVCGLQGTGKTTVAKKIAEKINAVILRSDVLRMEILKDPKYTEEEKQKIYDRKNRCYICTKRKRW